MAMNRIIGLLLAFALLYACSWEPIQVIEIYAPLAQMDLRDEQEALIVKCFNEVAAEFGMSLDEPYRKPGFIQYVAHYHEEERYVSFAMIILLVDRVQVFFRSGDVRSDFSVAEQAYELFRSKLDESGVTYSIRREVSH